GELLALVRRGLPDQRKKQNECEYGHGRAADDLALHDVAPMRMKSKENATSGPDQRQGRTLQSCSLVRKSDSAGAYPWATGQDPCAAVLAAICASVVRHKPTIRVSS